MSPTQIARRLDIARRQESPGFFDNTHKPLWDHVYRMGREDAVAEAYAAMCAGTDIRPMLAGLLGFACGLGVMLLSWWTP